MRKKGILSLAAAAVLMIGTLAWAADMATTSPVSGKITYVDTATGRFTLEDASGNSTTYDTTGNTTYMQSGRTVQISDLKVGDQVTVTATGSAGQYTAMSVNYGTTAGSTDSSYNAGSTTTGSTTNSYDRNNSGSMTGSTYDRNNTRSTTTANHQLPKTASPLPLLGLAGLVLLGAGAAMKVRTRGAH